MKINARCILLFISVVLPTAVTAQQSTPSPRTGELVWTWSRQCSGTQKLNVTVSLQRKVLYRGVLAICRGSREAENGRVEFHFAGGHIFQGKYRTRATDSVEGNIWQAGGDPDALVLGVSFDTKKRILLNTLHIAKPDSRTSSQLDDGLYITTAPLRSTLCRRDQPMAYLALA